jgi:isopenicillin N synthase-like dioxygenase
MSVTSFTSVPTVDISGLCSPDRTERERVADEIGRAAREVGFLYVSGSGLDESLFESMLAATKEFFALPVEEKMRSYIGLSRCHRGYVPVGEEGVETGTPDVKEAFDTALDLPADDPDYLAGNPMLGPNAWPELPGFAEAVTAYYDAILEVGHRLLWAFAVTLGEDPDVFSRHATGSSTTRTTRTPRTRSASELTPTTSASRCSSRRHPVWRCSTARGSGSTCRRWTARSS